MSQKPSRARRPTRGFKPAPQDRQRSKSSATGKPRPVSKRPATLRLRPGRFYADRTGAVWCCYRIDPNVAPNVQGLCVEVETDTVMGFYLDGRWDSRGQSPRTLVEERVAP